ncbi:MAG: M56 family metallopeptidase, partial [Planctomycetes bacterium]|nr:M56 family metallopeptidase [Planctomycetota bacterium]
MPLEALEAIVAHELAHIRRYDLWVGLLQRVVETLLFYHPAVWWLSHRLDRQRELCCDALAVQTTGQRVVYVQALEQAARRRSARARLDVAAAIGGDGKMRILERVRHGL